MWFEQARDFYEDQNNELKCHECQRPFLAAEKRAQLAIKRFSLPAPYVNKIHRPPRMMENSRLSLQSRISPWKSEAAKKKTRFSCPSIGPKDSSDGLKIRKSGTLPRISPCRKIDNLNIVLPAGPKLQLSIDSDESSRPPSSWESETISGETEESVKPVKKVPEILLKKQLSLSDSNDSGLEISPTQDDIVTPETPRSPQTIGTNSKNHFEFSFSTSDDKTKNPVSFMTLRRSTSDCAQFFSHATLSTIPEDPSTVPDEPVVINKKLNKSLSENCELERVEKRPVVNKGYKTGLVEGIIAELKKKCNTKVKSQFVVDDIYENRQDIEERKEKEREMKREIERKNEKMKKLQVKELIKRMEKDLKFEREIEMKNKYEEEKDEMKKQIEKEMKIQRELEMKKQHEMEYRILKKHDMKMQNELKIKFQREMKKQEEEKKKREEERKKQEEEKKRQEEEKKKQEEERKKQRRMEMKIQKEIEMKKQQRELELKKQRELVLSKQREIEMEKIREIEAKIQREKNEMRKKKEKENALRRQKEIEDEINLELSFNGDTSLIEDFINEMQERCDDPSTKNSSSIFDSRDFIRRLSLDAQERERNEKYKTFNINNFRNYIKRNESHQKFSECFANRNKENNKPNYPDLRFFNLFQSCENYKRH